jgi:hypothetical protein
MGNIVFRRSHTGEMSITKLPDMSVQWSAAQQTHRQRFKQAVAYAKAAMAEPTVRAVYAETAAQKNMRPFDLAVSDFFKGNDLLSKK